MTKNDDIEEIVNELQKSQLQLSDEINSYTHLHTILSNTINHLITNDFSHLISVLYRLDISEKKLQFLLKNAGNTCAGEIIAKMIIERQLQKMETKKSFTANDSFFNEEKW